MCSPRLSYREYERERERERVAKLLELANLQPTISAPLTQFMVTLSRMISRFCPQIYKKSKAEQEIFILFYAETNFFYAETKYLRYFQ